MPSTRWPRLASMFPLSRVLFLVPEGRLEAECLMPQETAETLKGCHSNQYPRVLAHRGL